MRYFIFSIFLMIAGPVWVQGQQLKGVVRDGEGEPMPYCNVYVENTSYGVVSNIKGEYFLQLKQGSYRIVFQSLGYEKQIRPVTISGSSQVLDVAMEPVGVELEDVEMSAGRKDPAYEIIENAIRVKKEFLQQYDGYTCETYLKATLEVDTLKKEMTAADSLKAEEKRIKEEAKKQEKEAERVADSIKAAEKRLKEDAKKEKEDADSLSVTEADSSKAGRKKGFNFGGAGNKEGEEKPLPRLNFLEVYSTTHYRYPGTYKSVITALKDLSEKKRSTAAVSFGADDGVSNANSSVGNPYLFHTDVSDAEFNFYQNLVNIPVLADKPFVSPISTTAKLYYRYRLIETFMENGRLIHKIEVIPFNQDAPLFKGEIFIMDKEWAIKAVNFEIQPTNLNFFKEFRLIHDYDKVGSGEWVLKREEYFYNTREGRIRFYGNTIALHKDYQINPDFPKNFFNNELVRVTDSAYSRDTSFWNNARPIALKRAETEFIQVQDSLEKYFNSPEYLAELDSTFNKVKFLDFIVFGVGFRNREKKREIFFDPILGSIRPLGVGGYRQALGGYYQKEFANAHEIQIRPEIDYGFNNQDLKGSLRVAYLYNPKHFARFYIRGGDVYSLVASYQTITASLSRSNYVRKVFGGVGHRWEVFNGLMADIGIEFADRRSIDSLDLAEWGQQLFGNNNTPASFEPYREALLDIKLQYSFRQKYYTEPKKKVIVGTDYPILELRYKKSIPGIFGSAPDFDFLELNLHDDIKLGTMGESRWNVYAGRFLRSDSILFTDRKFFGAADRFLYTNPMETFQLLKYTQSTTLEYLQMYYIHHFGTTITGRIPLLKRTRLETTAGAGILLMREGGFRHAEIYAGLEYPFRIRRQLFKIGAYYVAADSNFSTLSSTVKIGINVFDTFQKKWFY